MSTVPLHAAVGLRVRCPDEGCGATSAVLPPRGAAAKAGGLPPPPGMAAAGVGPVVQAPRWCIVQCPRTGAKLFPGHQPVEVVSDGG